MKLKYIALSIISMCAVQSINALTYTVINHSKRTILLLPDRSKVGEYEILKGNGESIKLRSTFHAVKTISWLVKDGGPESNKWVKYTAQVHLPFGPKSYNDFIIHPNGYYVNNLEPNSIGSEDNAKKEIITDSKGVYPRRIDEGIITN